MCQSLVLLSVVAWERCKKSEGRRRRGRGGSGVHLLVDAYGQITMLWVQRHLPHDDDLRLQQRSGGVVPQDWEAVVGEDDARLGFGIRWHLIAEGRRGEVETVCAN